VVGGKSDIDAGFCEIHGNFVRRILSANAARSILAPAVCSTKALRRRAAGEKSDIDDGRAGSRSANA
jgi:hypothetical protein